MASPFSGALQLTDLDDFIGPSQVGRPRASRAGGGSEPGRAPRETSLVCVFSQGPGPRASVSLVPFSQTQTTEAREGQTTRLLGPERSLGPWECLVVTGRFSV